MKRLFLILIIVLPVLSAQAQAGPGKQRPTFELTPLFGYHLGGAATFSEGRVDVADAASYGGVFSVVFDQGLSVDLSYTRSDSTVDFTADEPGYTDQTFRGSSNYIMAGINKDWLESRFRINLGGELGAAWFEARTSDVKDAWFFSMALKGGFKFYFTDFLGLRFQGRLLLPLDLSDGGFWLGIGTGGSGGGISLGWNVPIVQGDFLLGLIIRI